MPRSAPPRYDRATQPGDRMTILFTNARLIDPEALTDAPGSLLVQGGTIAGPWTGAKPPKGATVIDCGGKCLAPGIVDWGVKIGEPGERHRESFRSAGLAAAAGGVTTIIARPDTQPAIDTPETLEFVTRRAADASPVRIRHMAALTKAREGREMTEVGFLMDAGAIAFTDAFAVSPDTRALARALTYARSLGALVVGHPQEAGLSAGAARPPASSPRSAAFPPCRPWQNAWGWNATSPGRDDARPLPRRPDHHRALTARAGARQGGGAGRDRRHLDPPPHAQRIRRGRLPHLLQADAPPALRG